ncbi:MAG: RagB/SusD family nutrient uptake outer membrane protein [Rhodothermales bacterium]
MITHKKSLGRLGVGIVGLVLLTAGSILTLQGCTDLDEDTFGAITPDNFYNTEAEFVAALAPVYAQLRSAGFGGYWAASEITTDEAMIPTRGTDWDDGGVHRAFHQHKWDATHGDLNGAWNDAFTGVARANTVLDNLANSTTALSSKDAFEAELRTIRAFFYYQLMDLFGGVPIVTAPAVDPKNPPARASRQEVFEFIETELTEAMPNLIDVARGPDYGRVAKGAAQALLANMYLNAEVFTGTVTTGGLSRGTARWQDALNMADAVINSGHYELAQNYFDNFSVGNMQAAGNKYENIFSATYKAKGGLGLTHSMRMLHYTQLPQSPWNGYTTLADVWKSYSDEDARKKMFLVGVQREGPNANCVGQDCFSQGETLKDRSGNDLTFTEEAPLVGATEGDGIRVLKFELDPAQTGGDSGNDYPVFRLGEMWLIRAEALNELGRTPEAVLAVNVIRNRSNVADLNAADFNQASLRDQILTERLHELIYEAKRRQDQIRFGTFTSRAWHEKQPSEAFRVLMPVPQPQINANGALQQNPGY